MAAGGRIRRKQISSSNARCGDITHTTDRSASLERDDGATKTTTDEQRNAKRGVIRCTGVQKIREMMPE